MSNKYKKNQQVEQLELDPEGEAQAALSLEQELDRELGLAEVEHQAEQELETAFVHTKRPANMRIEQLW